MEVNTLHVFFIHDNDFISQHADITNVAIKRMS